MKRLFLRIALTLIAVLFALAYFTLPWVEKLIYSWSVRDLDSRAKLFSQPIQENLPNIILENSHKNLSLYMESFLKGDEIYALAYCNSKSKLIYTSHNFFSDSICSYINEKDKFISKRFKLSNSSLYLSQIPIHYKNLTLGNLILAQDMSYIVGRTNVSKKYLFYLFVTFAMLIALLSLSVSYFSWRGWIHSLRDIFKGQNIFRDIKEMTAPDLKPVLNDLKIFLKDHEKRLMQQQEYNIEWSPKKIREILKTDLLGEDILVVSNREPYIHNKTNNTIDVQKPASGLVSAVEPILRACSGTWIAHGSGNADKEVVDENDHVKVPPQNPRYDIRRVWLSEEEEKGYYYGFANEGLWPLCHIAHTRPLFRTQDWEMYQSVNQKFSEIVVEEAKRDDPVILIQDYHFALLPYLIRQKLPRATIITFWHIPWPNPESFGICPWKEKILEGLLGSTILGFHTRFHVNNFIDTVDRYLESRIDRETSVVSYKTKLSAVRHYPISTDWPPPNEFLHESIEDCRTKFRKDLKLPHDQKIAISVDRMDYTKGILEKFYSVERFFEKYPQWIGKFTFVQIAAPTRTRILRYKEFNQEVEELNKKICERFTRNNCPPLILLNQHHNSHEVFQAFRASEVCYVGSLHDGMNLVAKEYVSSRNDLRGSLILSSFAGASIELTESLSVNPYNFDQCADALNYALNMSEGEQEERMNSMRDTVRINNVYRWAGKMLLDASYFKKRRKILENINEWKPLRTKLFPL